MSAGCVSRTGRADGGYSRTNSCCATRKLLMLTTSGGFAPKRSIRRPPLEREDNRPAAMKTGGASSGYQSEWAEMAPGCFGGTRAQRRFTYMRKRTVWRQADQLSFPQKIPQKIKGEIYGWASEKQDWFVTRKAASSSSLPPTGFRRGLFINCSPIAKGGSGFCPVRVDLVALTIHQRNVR